LREWAMARENVAVVRRCLDAIRRF